VQIYRSTHSLTLALVGGKSASRPAPFTPPPPHNFRINKKLHLGRSFPVDVVGIREQLMPRLDEVLNPRIEPSRVSVLWATDFPICFCRLFDYCEWGHK
jgi:hypothetical protein